ncbi:unnamed protein product [Mycena citricolor]|uniref:Uncharacterized protein n=1 Tax=Mycena citricolor TaxID=2018698 RepID=A0AAD2HRW5_9AGAR|nr:unnamed protein product [Mycena citricolor]
MTRLWQKLEAQDPSDELVKWPIFVTVVNPDPKVINRLFLSMQSFFESEHLEDSKWVIITSSRDIHDGPDGPPPATTEPWTAGQRNDFAGMSMEALNHWTWIHMDALDDRDLFFEDWAVIDQTAYDTGTVVVVKRWFGPSKEIMESDPSVDFEMTDEELMELSAHTEEYVGLRMPPEQAYMAFGPESGRKSSDYWCGLRDTLEPDGTTEILDGAYRLDGNPKRPERRSIAFEAWRSQGYID